MDHIAVDLGGRESQICVRGSDGAILEERRYPTGMLGQYLIFMATGDATYLSVTTSIYAPVPQDRAVARAASSSAHVVTRAVNQPSQPNACGSKW